MKTKLSNSIQCIAVFALFSLTFCSKKEDSSRLNLLVGAAALNRSGTFGTLGSTGTGTETGTSASAPSGLSYNSSPLSFLQGSAVNVTPTVTGTVTNCTSSTSLPSGLSLSSTT
ncbi:MAG TPA: hypothetical protein PL163_15520, partial [Leptospiraceae bacterium]|nr:hypothetical protein [Leptospiraceae bacterium]